MKKIVKAGLARLGIEIHRITPTSARAYPLTLDRLSSKGGCLIAGPFLGEFGWELMQWQGYIRHLSQFYEKTIVYGRDSSAYFYRDFAAEFRPVAADSWDTDGYELHNFDYRSWAQKFPSSDLLVATNACHKLRDIFSQKFIPFGERKTENAYDVIIHARAIPKLNGNTTKHTRNWPEENWDSLCASLGGLKIAAIGVPALAYAPPGTIDLRGVDTETLCSILASSRSCIGPSSGAMHLASLCRTPHLVWTSLDYEWGFGGSAFRYLRSWNPFAAKAAILTDMGFQPSVGYVSEELKRFLAA